jgi:hypothetical protein
MARDNVSVPYKTTDKIAVLNILIQYSPNFACVDYPAYSLWICSPPPHIRERGEFFLMFHHVS